MKLSIAVICKNEGKNIERCLKSIFDNLKQIQDAEVLVVDSFSTDDTIEIASRYPVKIIRLRENWPHSPAAGRYTAFMHTRGKYTMCIDADMKLMEGFLERALKFMDNHPLAAGVTGIIKHVMLSTTGRECLNIDGGELFPVESRQWNGQAPGLLKSIPGAGLFRSKAVLHAGNFHPFLRAEEEYELCQRLRKMRHELWYLPYRIAEHHGYTGKGLDELKRRWKKGFMNGIGDMFKLSMLSGFVLENLIRFQQHLIISGYIILAPLFFMLGFFHAAFPLLWVTGLIFIIAAFCYKKMNLEEGLCATLNKAITGICIYRMLFSHIPAADAYPSDPIIIDLSVR